MKMFLNYSPDNGWVYSIVTMYQPVSKAYYLFGILESVLREVFIEFVNCFPNYSQLPFNSTLSLHVRNIIIVTTGTDNKLFN